MLDDLLAVWFPKCCWGCKAALPKKQQWLCVRCQAQLPKTYFECEENNQLNALLRQYLPLESAYAPFYVKQKTPIQDLLHALKYKGKPNIGVWMAQQCFARLPKKHPMRKRSYPLCNEKGSGERVTLSSFATTQKAFP